MLLRALAARTCAECGAHLCRVRRALVQSRPEVGPCQCSPRHLARALRLMCVADAGADRGTVLNPCPRYAMRAPRAGYRPKAGADGGAAGRQVHRAALLDGTEVAVKVIYPSLRKEMASDFAMFRFAACRLD